MAMTNAQKSRRSLAKKRAAYIALHGCPPKIGGNHRPQTFKNCEGCGVWFGPLSYLAQRFCSRACKYEWQDHKRAPSRRVLTHVRTAQNILAYHVKVGHLTRPTVCEECGATGRRIQAAHFDYREPLRVRWLCRSCHAKWDWAEPKGATVRLSRYEQCTGNEPERREAG